ncbi:MAG: glycosyltransferase family 2 protein [Phycisphaerae bacterium]
MTGRQDDQAPGRYSLSVFFPCYNEAGNIRRVVAEAMGFLPTVSDDFEVILVDDGSGDGTGEIADELAAGDGRIRAVHHEVNRGYGGALQSGFRAATKELVFYTDGDGQFDITDLAGMLPLIAEHDIVNGYRRRRQDSVIRRLNAYLWGVLVQKVLGFRCRDVDSAFKLYRREIFDHMEMKSMGALIDAEIIARARRAGLTLAEVPVRHRRRLTGRQTGANVRVIARAFKELWQLRKAILATPSLKPDVGGRSANDRDHANRGRTR